MSKIYDQHDAAFSNVAAYVVLKDGDRAATVAFKLGATVTAYVHWFGIEMVRGRAYGGGYDRQSAAVADAVAKLAVGKAPNFTGCATFKDALDDRDGRTWLDRLRDAGFTVFQAV